MIKCENVSKSYGDQNVISSFSYEFCDKGFYLLLGESGSGKTTFLNILSGFIPFDEGRITWGDRTFEGIVDNSLVGSYFDYITQDACFVDFLTVSDNLKLVSDNDDEINKMLRRFGIDDKAKQLPATLSGGEKQRLAVARALLNGKKVLFLDEPTAALDEDNKKAVFELLAELKKSVLVICSSHDEMAKDYADEIIVFKKTGEKCIRSNTAKSEKIINKRQVKLRKKKNLNSFLIKWFKSGNRNGKSALLFTFFLMLSFILCLLADTPGHKLDSSVEYMYKINSFTVVTSEKAKWSDVSPDGKGISSVVLDYCGSCPKGSEDLPADVIFRPLPDYELSLNVLPYDKESFKLSEKVEYGSYFTGDDQIILSSEMACALYPSDPSVLIGQHLTKKIYSLGEVDFEVVGIFESFNDAEMTYMASFDVPYRTGREYNEADYTDLCFVSSKLTERFENDDSFYADKQRTYRVCFNSYRDMKKYYDRYSGELMASDKVISISYDNVDVCISGMFYRLFYVLFPIAVFTVFFSALFYSALKKTEFEHNNKFISVFEYSGYSKKRVINRFILLNILDLIKMLVAAEASALVITVIINLINRKLLFVGFQIFSYNLVMIALYNLVFIVTSVIAVNLLFTRVIVSSWYENLIENRDLI